MSYDVREVKAKELYQAVYGTASKPAFLQLFCFPWLKSFPSHKR